ncbi:efflux RND transporter permease subunit, partial [bacterium]|nr:efflux RND transporter permease subunit [bacterium]
KPLAYTVSFAMLGSLIFAVALAPVLSALVMRRKNKTDSAVVKILQKPYKPLVSFFVNKSWLALSVAVVLLVIGAFLFPKLGSEFTPELNEGTIVVRMTMAPSISLTESTRMVQIVERRLLTIPDVQEIVTRIGRGEIGAHADPINSAEVFVILNQNASDNIEDIIRHKIDDIPGILFNLTQPIETTIDELLEGVRAELAIKIFGDDLDELKIQADKIASVVKEVPGAADIQVDQVSGAPQLLIRIDRKAIARYGINVADVQSVIHAAVGGEVAGQIFEGVRRFDIMVRYELNARDSAVAIGNILINGPDGLKVPLDELATIEEIVGNRQITRENNQRFISIQCNVVDRDIGSFVKEAQSEIDHDIDLPAGYMVTWGGQFRLQQEANKRLALVVPFTLLAVFLLLLSSFGSIKNTLLILLNIPLALVGGIAALCFSGQNLSVPASVGFIALFGIALENGMVLVTCINQLVKKGMSVNEAAIMGACLRLRPVLMTALTTALGLIPLLIATGTGSEVQRPLATVVIGGLITSTILTLLVIPALFRWFKAK